MQAGVVGPERGANRTGEPVERDVRQQVVAAEGVLQVAVAIGPGAELLDDPCGKPGRGIAQAESEGLRPGSLDPLVAGLFLQELANLFGVAPLLQRGTSRQGSVGPQRRQIDWECNDVTGGPR